MVPTTKRGRLQELLWSRDFLFAAALVVAVFVAYQPCWRGGFIWDDAGHVAAPQVRSWHGLGRIWLDPGATPQYYPLTYSAFWLEHNLWGDATLGYHLVNLGLHAAAALLAGLLLRRLKVPGAYLAAAIFALHPVHAESVAWIQELKNTLSAVFYLGAALVYLRFDETRKASSYSGGLALFVLALLSKTDTVTLPATLLVVFWWQRGRLSWRRDVVPLAPFFLAGVALGLLTVVVERHTGAEGTAFSLTLIERGLVAGRATWFYLGKLLWPADLVLFYPRWQISHAVWWQYLFPTGVLLLLVGLWGLRRRSRGPLAGLLLFVGTLAPVLGFVNVYYFLFSFVADHFQYLASLAVMALVSAGIAWLLKRAAPWRRTAGQMACAALVAGLTILTWRQSRMYADCVTLYRAAIAVNPDCSLVHTNLAAALIIRGDLAEAIVQCRAALKIQPHYADAHHNLAGALARQGKFAEAVAEYEAALKIDPRSAETRIDLGSALAGQGKIAEAIAQYQDVLRIHPDNPAAHNNLGAALAARDQVAESLAQYQRALEIDPDNAEAHYNLGAASAGRGEIDAAIAHFEKSLQTKPDNAEARNQLGLALAGRGRIAAAIAQYQQALEVKPDYAQAHNNLGTALQSLGQFEAAIAQYRHAVKVKPDYYQAHYNLGNALLSAGQVEAAIAEYRQALKLKPDLANAHGNLGTALAMQGQIADALAEYREAIRLQPEDLRAQRGMAWIRATSPEAQFRDGAEAVKLARRAVELSPDDLNNLDTLAAAYAEAGRFAEAAQTAHKAIELANEEHQPSLAESMRARLRLYEARKPYREPQSPLAGFGQH